MDADHLQDCEGCASMAAHTKQFYLECHIVAHRQSVHHLSENRSLLCYTVQRDQQTECYAHQQEQHLHHDC